ncbi:BON domain-containing protein [Proteus mirabilis]
MTVTMISTATIAETSWYNEIDKTTSNVNNELSDTAISKKIEETLLPNPSIDSGSLSIRTEFGHVTVAGFVKNAEQENKSFRSLKKIDGVKSVESSVNIQG